VAFNRVQTDVSVPGITDSITQTHSFAPVAQQIFRLFGVHKVLLDILHIPLPPNCVALRDIFELTYNVLSLWCEGNKDNLKILERYVPFFFSQMTIGPSPTLLLSVITLDNFEVASRIPASCLEEYLAYLACAVVLTPEDLRRMQGRGGAGVSWWNFTSAFDHNWKRSGIALQFLKGVVRCSGRLVRQNQILVVKGICENPNILGALSELEDEKKLNGFLAVLNTKISGPAFQLGKMVGRDLKVAGMTVHNVPDDEKKGPSSPRAAAALLPSPDLQKRLMQKQYYLEVVSVLTRCAPCKYVYQQDRAIREAEESSLLVRAALPMKSLIQVLSGLKDASAKIPILRLFEQVYGTEMGSLNPRLKLKLLNCLATSVDYVARHLEHSLGVRRGDGKVTAAPAGVDVTNYDYIYVFDVVLPFFVGFFHTSFRVSTASREEVDLAKDIFDNVMSLTKLAVEYRTRDGDEIAPALAAAHKGFMSARSSFSMDSINSRIVLGGFSLDNALNCLMHMADPTGSGMFRDTVEGVMGSQKQDEFIAFFKRLQNLVQTEQDRTTDPPDAPGARNKRVETSMERWVRHNKHAFLPGAKKEQNDFFEFLAKHNVNRVLLRKIILLLGDFAKDRNVQVLMSGRQGTGNDWVDANASRFCIAYLNGLQKLVDMDQDDSTRELLLELGVARVLMNLITISSSLKVKKASFGLANALLAAGKVSQDAFRDEYYSQGSTAFFMRLRDLLSTPLKIRTKQEVQMYGVRQPPERFGSWPLTATIMRFLQSLCEGHNLEWQNLLNHQTLAGSGGDDAASSGGVLQTGISVNVVSELCEFMSRLLCGHGPLWYVVVYWDRWYDMTVIQQVWHTADRLLNAIIEVQQGPCASNQLEITHGRFIESINWLLDAILTAETSKLKKNDRGNQYGSWTQEAKEGEEDEGDGTVGRQTMLLEIQHLITTNFCSTLEGNVVATIPRRIIAVLNFTLIQQLMDIYLRRFDDSNEQDDPDLEDPFAVVCINYFILTRNLMSRWESSGCTGAYSPSFESLLKSRVYNQCKLRFDDMIGSVELLRDGIVEEVLFRIPGTVLQQAETPTFQEACTRTNYSVRRDNQPSKLDDFLTQSDDLVYELIAWPTLKASWLVRRNIFFTNATFFLALILNIMSMVPAFQNDGSDSTVHYQFTRPESLLIWLFGILQIIFAVLRIMSFTAAHVPTFMYQYRSGDLKYFFETNAESRLGRWTVLSWRWARFLTAFFLNGFTLYQVLYVAFSVIALQYHAFYAYHLFDLIGRSNQLREVFSSLGAYGNTLGVTALLWVILIYGFVVWGFLGFPDDFKQATNAGNMGSPGNGLSGSCYSPFECFIYHLDFSLRQGGGIGDTLLPMSVYWPTDLGHWYGRGIYDLVFFIIVCVVMTAIVTGIIIDAFGASRDHRKEVEENQAGQCFICGIEGSRFESKRPKDKNDTRHYGFQWHLDKEHNQWQYVYFLAYLAIKDSSEYTGSESYVSELVRGKQTDFFPMDRSLMLEA